VSRARAGRIRFATGRGARFFWLVRDHTSEARSWLERVLAAPGAEVVTRARAKARLASWIFAQVVDDDAAAPAAVDEAVLLYRQLGDRRGIVWSLWECASQALFESDYDRAKPMLAEAFEVAKDLGDRWVTAQVVEMQGVAAKGQGENRTARRHFEESLALFRATGDHQAIGSGLLLLDVAAGEQADGRAATGYFKEAVPIFRELGRAPGYCVGWPGGVGAEGG
jgi:tetratricopeptide (TPR) repeat protein